MSRDAFSGSQSTPGLSPSPARQLISERIQLPSLALEYLAAPAPAGKEAPLSGGADPELVICLHGFPDIPRCWSSLISELGVHGYRGVAPWLRGYAPTDLAGPFSVRRLAEDVRELADALSPERPVSLVGHDWGALITYAALALWPERFRRAVTLAVPHPLNFLRQARLSQLRRSWYMLFFQSRFLPETLVPRDEFALIERLWRDWSPSHTPAPEYMAELKACLRASMPSPIGYYRALPLGALRDRQLLRKMAGLSVPLLYLHGSQDGCVGWELMQGQERFFAAEHESELLGGVGHFLQLENPRAVNQRILSWLAG